VAIEQAKTDKRLKEIKAELKANAHDRQRLWDRSERLQESMDQ